MDDEVHRVAAQLRDQRFAVTAAWSGEALRNRIAAFDEIVADLCCVEAMVCRWGTLAGLESATLPMKRLCDDVVDGVGNTGWLAIQWYPILRVFYAGGIAAVAGGSVITPGRALMLNARATALPERAGLAAEAEFCLDGAASPLHNRALLC